MNAVISVNTVFQVNAVFPMSMVIPVVAVNSVSSERSISSECSFQWLHAVCLVNIQYVTVFSESSEYSDSSVFMHVSSKCSDSII